MDKTKRQTRGEEVSAIQKKARLAGLLYLLVAIFSGFAMSVRSSLIVPSNAVLTTQKIQAAPMLFRINIVSDLVGQVFHVLLALVLYELFKAINKRSALLMLALALVPVPIAMLNQLNQLAVLPLLGSSDYGQIIFLLNLHAYGVLIAQIFWGLWLLPMSCLFYRSRYIPRALVVLLVVAGLGYVADSFGKFLLPQYNLNIAVYTFIGEVTLLLWLLVKGVRTNEK